MQQIRRTLFLIIGFSLCLPPLAFAETPIKYPPARKSDQIDEYHGVKVSDPYRWLEDADSAETKAWVEAENKLTQSFLATIPQRDAIKRRLTKLWDYEKFGIPTKEAGRYFYRYNPGLRNQGVLYVADSLDAKPRILIDPNTLSDDGTVALGRTEVSEDGKHLAYSLAAAGSDWNEIRVRDIETGRDTADRLQWIKSTAMAWTHDHKGFFYSRFPQPEKGQELRAANYNQKLYYHRLGTEQSKDVLIYERPDQREWGFAGLVTEDGQYLIIVVHHGTRPETRVFYKDLISPAFPAIAPDESPVEELLDKADADYDFLGNDGFWFWFLTDKDAPRKRVVAIDSRPKTARWRELIPQSNDAIESASVVGDRFFIRSLHDARTRVSIYSLDGKPERELELPGIGAASGFAGKRRDTETFYQFTAYTNPGTIYRYDIASGKSTIFRQPKVDFDSNAYETKQVFFPSKDGTRIPMFITHRKGLKLDGSNPTLLYGYGGFHLSQTPRFGPSTAVWLEMGGVYAVANLRGGGEYGQHWHDAGRLLNKQNVFDDFIAAAQYLIDSKYTSREKLAIAGGSNGGLLVGACMTQRPDLFGAALPAVGVMDMLRFHKFTVGWGWISDYGSVDDPAQFKALLAYSPLHKIKPGARYPATLVTTSDHDDRVVPAHSFKFAAALQAAQAKDGPPCLIRVETRAGHGGGKPTAKAIDLAADEWAFLVKVLSAQLPESFTQRTRN